MWSDISWILENYSMSHTEEMSTKIYYMRISKQWRSEPPVNVARHPPLCPCPYRCQWNVATTLANVEYN